MTVSMIGIITQRTPAMPTSRINVHIALQPSSIFLILSPLKDCLRRRSLTNLYAFIKR